MAIHLIRLIHVVITENIHGKDYNNRQLTVKMAVTTYWVKAM